MILAEDTVIQAILKEYNEAVLSNGSFHSAHEGIAVIKEEYDELWDEIKKKREARDHGKMFKEAIQIAAMGMRFAVDICMDENGEVPK